MFSNEINESKIMLDTIINGVDDGIFVVDKDLKITLFNKKAVDISGFSSDEVLNHPYYEVLNFVFEEDEKNTNDFIKKVFTEGMVEETIKNTILFKKDKTRINVSYGANPVKDEKGITVGCIVAFRDVTKETEVDKKKTEFISIASHNLKTPLSIIKWISEFLLDKKIQKSDAEKEEYLNDIYLTNKRMIRLVENLINIFHIETGDGFTIKKTSVDIVKLIDISIEDNQQLAKSKNINLVKSEGINGEILIEIDEGKIKQVFNNLIDNAINYSPDGSTVNIDLIKKEKEIDFVVSDSGIGILKEQQGRVYEKFFRGDNAIEKETSGTGLGLYISKKIVEGHGGSIRFESESGISTKFYVSLPIN